MQADAPQMIDNATVLPKPYSRWVTTLLGTPLPDESVANCTDCVMCTPELRGPSSISFEPGTRCCTFRPRLANFMAGFLLQSNRPEWKFGRETLAERISGGEAGLLGIMTDPAYLAVYQSAGASAFGQAQSMSCPHQFSDGRCGIRDFRSPTCSTWFCKYERGARGQELWQAVHDVLLLADRVVALWCLNHLQIDVEKQLAALEELSPQFSAARIDHRRDERSDRELWGEWYGCEKEFYIACAGLVADLEWETLLEIGGYEFVLYAKRAQALARKHADQGLPEALRAGQFQVTNADDGLVWLLAYNPYDPLEVSSDVLAFITRCDGRDTQSTINSHVDSGGHYPDRILIRTLLDHGILEPA